jgi:hypothetical protein
MMEANFTYRESSLHLLGGLGLGDDQIPRRGNCTHSGHDGLLATHSGGGSGLVQERGHLEWIAAPMGWDKVHTLSTPSSEA